MVSSPIDKYNTFFHGSDYENLNNTLNNLKIVNNLDEINGEVYKVNDHLFINGKELDNDKYYTVATVDFLFDKTEYPFLKGQNIKNEGILYRDLLILDIENATKNNEKWNPTV